MAGFNEVVGYIAGMIFVGTRVRYLYSGKR